MLNYEKVGAARSRPGEPLLALVVLSDSDYPGLLCEMRFRKAETTWLDSITFTRSRDDANEEAGPLTAGEIRDVPLARWIKAASMKVRAVFLHPTFGLPIAPPAGTYMPHEAVDKLYPGLGGSSKPADIRRYKSFYRLAEVTREYVARGLRGEPDVTASLAKDYGVRQATIRSWIHRAKAAGFHELYGLGDEP